MDPNLRHILLTLLILIVSLTVHELAHAKAAEVAGDDTARKAGRISLNPLDHLDPIGTVMMVFMIMSGWGIGWAKPVPVSPYKFRHPRWDNLKVSLWGPLSNVLLALVVGLVIRFGWNYFGPDDLMILRLAVMINLGLALFNMIPIPPLDGSHILSSLLPIDAARAYDMFTMRYSMFLLLGLIFLAPAVGIPVLGYVLGPPREFLFTLFTGHSYLEFILKGGI